MKRCLLDSSFVIDLLNEMSDDLMGPARTWAIQNPSTDLWISPVTYAEVMEGASDDEALVAEILASFRWQTIGHQHARRVALLQRRSARRLGDNDAWQVALAEAMDATLVGHDPKAFARPGIRYEDHRAAL
ncbi:MAG: type II toxin-antitoxin system VapC family toxin [Burkholderiales bacterium]|nr:type II toxin-antitoxin system VapC family toxin [Opitutaceae bacterium]